MRVFGEAKVGKDLKKNLMTMHMHAYMQVFVRVCRCLYVSGANVWRANTISGVRPQEPSTLLSQDLPLAWVLLMKPGWSMSLSPPPCTVCHHVLLSHVGSWNQAGVIMLCVKHFAD